MMSTQVICELLLALNAKAPWSWVCESFNKQLDNATHIDTVDAGRPTYRCDRLVAKTLIPEF